jgi:hypothetical protein
VLRKKYVISLMRRFFSSTSACGRPSIRRRGSDAGAALAVSRAQLGGHDVIFVDKGLGRRAPAAETASALQQP